MIREQLRKYRDDFNNCKNDLKNVKTWYKQIPNLLTISRPIGMIPANILFFTGNIVPAVILTGSLLLTDLFDGKLARKWNVQSKLGADLDAVGDKIMFLGMALPIIASNPLILINVLLEGAISYINVLGRLQDMDTKTVYSGKLKTWFLSLLLLIGYITQFFSVPKTILDVIMAITCVSQGITLSDYVNEYKKMKQEQHEKMLYEYQKKLLEVDELVINKEREKIIHELSKEKEFLLAVEEPDKLSKPKKRTLNKRNNSNLK